MMDNVTLFKEKFSIIFCEKLKDIIEELASKGSKSLALHFYEIDRIDSDLGDAILRNPVVALEGASRALQDIDTAFENTLKYLRLKSALDKIKLSKIKPAETIGKLIEFEGIVKRITEVHPRTQKVVWQCEKCGAEIKQKVFSIYELPEERITPPHECPSCGRRSIFSLLDNKSENVNYQKIEIQEFFEEIALSGTKHRMIVYTFDDMTNVVGAGDRVKVVGILQSKPAWRGKKGLSTVLHTECVALWIEPIEKAFEEIDITQEDIEKIKEASKDPDIYKKLVDSIAPSIYGMEAIKKGILFQLFGGCPKVTPDGIRRRGDIHILLVGDPGTAKSQLTYYATKLSPKGIFVSGKTATASGLIASVVKDSEFGEGKWTLDAGVMALADMGLVGLDELDKMRKEDRDALHTAMEQQEVNVSKAGITATLKTRCSVLANANPKMGRFEDCVETFTQIVLPASLLSRFDLIFTLKDKANKEMDRMLARHVLNMHSDKYVKTPFDINFIRKYIAYAKKHIHPKLTEEAKRKIEDYYVETRSKNKDILPLTPRYLETLIRLAEASARVRLSNRVEEIDVDNAVEVLEYSLWTSAYDEYSNTFDIDKIATGISATRRQKSKIVLSIIEDYYKNNRKGIKKDELIERASEEGIDVRTLEEIIDLLKKNNRIYEPKHNMYLPIEI